MAIASFEIHRGSLCGAKYSISLAMGVGQEDLGLIVSTAPSKEQISQCSRPVRWSLEEFHHLGTCHLAANFQPRDRDGKTKSPWTSASRIYVQHSLALFYGRLM